MDHISLDIKGVSRGEKRDSVYSVNLFELGAHGLFVILRIYSLPIRCTVVFKLEFKEKNKQTLSKTEMGRSIMSLLMFFRYYTF